jgi:ribosomal protein L11 methyltransferase
MSERYTQFNLRLPNSYEACLNDVAGDERVLLCWWDRAVFSVLLSGVIRAEERRQFEPVLQALVAEAGIGHLSFDPVEDYSWREMRQARMEPLQVGRFWIHFDAKDRVPEGSIPLFLSEVGAFGTGHHVTTGHCLKALEQLRQPPRRVADIGCGSGLLSLAMAALWDTELVACDIDPKSVLVTRDNFVANGVNGQAVRSDGMAHPAMQGPYDLIVANLLNDVLQELAFDIATRLAPHGKAILSGISSSGCDRIVDLYATHGLTLEQRQEERGWATLLLSR